MTKLAARRYLIGGRVQGVGFRIFTADVARREGLVGFVCNLPDGRVEAQVEGTEPAIDRFERALRQGPPGAMVGVIETNVSAPQGGFSEFRVRA